MEINPGSSPFIHVGKTTVQNGRASVELLLSDYPGTEEKAVYVLCLWDENGALVFRSRRPVAEEGPCVIQILHPHLWEGADKPYLYQLELFVESTKPGAADGEVTVQLLAKKYLPIRAFCDIPGKGLFLNGHPFSPARVCMAPPVAACDREKYFFDVLHQRKFVSLIQMGANIVCVDESRELSELERQCLQEVCDRFGLIFEGYGNLSLQKSDTSVDIDRLFDGLGHPTEVYYKYKAMWSKEPFVYISNEGLCRQPDGGYFVRVYSNRKRIVLLVNGAVFAFQKDGPEFLFQDLQIKSFPVWLSAEGEECGMSVVCHEG